MCNNRTIILSGPSTIGKNPLINEICTRYCYKFVTPFTTRIKRKEEKNNYDYYFLNRESFVKSIKNNVLVEWDYVLDNFYGFDDSIIINDGLKITHCLSRMALRIKQKNPNVILIFLKPKTKNDIVDKLNLIYEGRDLDLRIMHLNEELALSDMFDYEFTNISSLSALDNPDFEKLINMPAYKNGSYATGV